MKTLILSLTILVFISLCSQSDVNSQDIAQQAKTACINLCKAALTSGQYLDNGPCLSDVRPEWNPNWSVNDWACDIAHLPRTAIDNLEENQCQAFKEGKAHHFVEVYSNCSLIRAV
jgi:hypothetical protein